jgi:hypothetical protein
MPSPEPATASAQSRASASAGPHDRFRSLADARRVIALATKRSPGRPWSNPRLTIAFATVGAGVAGETPTLVFVAEQHADATMLPESAIRHSTSVASTSSSASEIRARAKGSPPRAPTAVRACLLFIAAVDPPPTQPPADATAHPSYRPDAGA